MIITGPGLQVETLTHYQPGKRHHAHCSGIVAFPDGELFAVFYWALKEANRKQAIFGVRKLPAGDWSAPELLVSDWFRMVGNPAVWIAPDTGKLWLFYVRSWGGWAVCNPRYKVSEDRGHTWSHSRSLYWFISRGIKNPPIMTSRGWYVLPAYIEFRDYFTIFYVSKDKGAHWHQSERVKIPDQDVPDQRWGRLVLQPTLIERRDGSLLALMRAKRPLGRMYRTESHDMGFTWTPAKPYGLPNPGGGFHMIRLQSGNLAIIYNHAPVPPDHGFERNPLSVALSEDDGETWAYRRNLVEGHDEHLHVRIGGYPTMTQGPDGRVHATWSYAHREEYEGRTQTMTDIQYASFTEEWVRERPFFEGPWEPREKEERIKREK